MLKIIKNRNLTCFNIFSIDLHSFCTFCFFLLYSSIMTYTVKWEVSKWCHSSLVVPPVLQENGLCQQFKNVYRAVFCSFVYTTLLKYSHTSLLKLHLPVLRLLELSKSSKSCVSDIKSSVMSDNADSEFICQVIDQGYCL